MHGKKTLRDVKSTLDIGINFPSDQITNKKKRFTCFFESREDVHYDNLPVGIRGEILGKYEGVVVAGVDILDTGARTV